MNALNIIEFHIKEHERSGYFTNEEPIEELLNNNDLEGALMAQYDLARYQTLVNLYNELTRLQNEGKI